MVKKYVGVSLPETLISKLDAFLKENPEYQNRSDFIKEAVRVRIQQIENNKE